MRTISSSLLYYVLALVLVFSLKCPWSCPFSPSMPSLHTFCCKISIAFGNSISYWFTEPWIHLIEEVPYITSPKIHWGAFGSMWSARFFKDQIWHIIFFLYCVEILDTKEALNNENLVHFFWPEKYQMQPTYYEGRWYCDPDPHNNQLEQYKAESGQHLHHWMCYILQLILHSLCCWVYLLHYN